MLSDQVNPARVVREGYEITTEQYPNFGRKGTGAQRACNELSYGGRREVFHHATKIFTFPTLGGGWWSSSSDLRRPLAPRLRLDKPLGGGGGGKGGTKPATRKSHALPVFSLRGRRHAVRRSLAAVPDASSGGEHPIRPSKQFFLLRQSARGSPAVCESALLVCVCLSLAPRVLPGTVLVRSGCWGAPRE